MTIDRVAMKELLEKGSDQDLLREMLAFVAARRLNRAATSEIDEPGHGFWMIGARKLDAGCITDAGCGETHGARR